MKIRLNFINVFLIVFVVVFGVFLLSAGVAEARTVYCDSESEHPDCNEGNTSYNGGFSPCLTGDNGLCGNPANASPSASVSATGSYPFSQTTNTVRQPKYNNIGQQTGYCDVLVIKTTALNFNNQGWTYSSPQTVNFSAPSTSGSYNYTYQAGVRERRYSQGTGGCEPINTNQVYVKQTRSLTMNVAGASCSISLASSPTQVTANTSFTQTFTANNVSGGITRYGAFGSSSNASSPMSLTAPSYQPINPGQPDTRLLGLACSGTDGVTRYFEKDIDVISPPSASLLARKGSESYSSSVSFTGNSQSIDFQGQCSGGSGSGGSVPGIMTFSFGSGTATTTISSSGTYTLTCNNGATSSVTVTKSTPQPPMEGVISATNCSISAGANSCNSTVSWDTTNPQGTSSVTTPTNVTVATGNLGSTAYSVAYGSRAFYLYNNSQELASTTATASCASGTSWNGSICATAPTPSCSITLDANRWGGDTSTSVGAQVGGSPVPVNWSSSNTTSSITKSWAGGTYSSSGTDSISIPGSAGNYSYTLSSSGPAGPCTSNTFTINVSGNTGTVNVTSNIATTYTISGGTQSPSPSSGTISSPNAYGPSHTFYPGNSQSQYTVNISPAAQPGYFSPSVYQVFTGNSPVFVQAGETKNILIDYSPAPDLTAGSVSPASATAGTTTTFSATVTNQGARSTNVGFSNFFQVASAANGGGTITDKSSSSTSSLGAGSSRSISTSHSFSSAGTYSMRACADKSSAANSGVINESNEGNNCGGWTNISVTAAPVMSGTLTASSCTITAGASTCNSSLVWSTTNPVATSTVTTPTNVTVATGNSGSTTYAVTNGSRTFYLYNNSQELTNATATATCTSGTTWNGSTCAYPAVTATLTANPTSVSYNGSSTLTWSSTGAATCTASGDWSGSKAISGSQSTGNLTSSKTYSLTCTGAGGTSPLSTATVNVGAEPLPDLTAGGISPTSATPGSSTTYSATVSNIGSAATGSGTINHIFQFDADANHGSINYIDQDSTSGNIPTGGSKSISASRSLTAGTWYIRACADFNTSYQGSVTESNEDNNCGPWTTVSVAWSGTPSGAISANPASCTIEAGSSSCTTRLSWSTANPQGTSAVTSNTPSPGTTVFTGNSGNNQSTYADYSSRTFYLYNNGYELDSVTVPANCESGTTWSGTVCETIVYSPTATLSANPFAISSGESSSLSWSSTHANSCTGTNFSTGGATSGTVTVTPPTTTTYSVVCTGPGGQAPDQATVTVTVTNKKPIFQEN